MFQEAKKFGCIFLYMSGTNRRYSADTEVKTKRFKNHLFSLRLHLVSLLQLVMGIRKEQSSVSHVETHSIFLDGSAEKLPNTCDLIRETGFCFIFLTSFPQTRSSENIKCVDARNRKYSELN